MLPTSAPASSSIAWTAGGRPPLWPRVVPSSWVRSVTSGIVMRISSPTSEYDEMPRSSMPVS
jgi:hypothetical protein